MNEEMHRSTNPDFQLDIMDLHTEIGKQTSTYAYYSDQLVEAKADRERLLNRLDLRESQIELEIRKDAEDSGQKLTETRIQSLIKVRDEIVDLKEKIVEANRAVGGLATAMSGPAMAVAIGYALQAPPLVLFSLITVGFASNALGGAGGPLAVLFVAIISAEVGKAVSKETKIDILVTPLVTIGVGIALSAWWAPAPAGAVRTACLR